MQPLNVSYSLPVIQLVKPVAVNTLHWVTKHFPAIQSTSFGLMGLREIHLSSRYNQGNRGAVIYNLWQARKNLREYYETHGCVLICAGCVGLVGGIYQITSFSFLSRGLLTFANLVALKFHWEELGHTKQIIQRKSAIIGIMTNLNYVFSAAILAASTFWFHWDGNLADFFAGIALIFGGIKTVHDSCCGVL